MDARELEEFDLGIDLAKNKQEQAAHFMFNRLLENHPDNIYLLALCAFTASTPKASLAAIETALKLDPANAMLLEAKAWLEDYHHIAVKTAGPSSNSSPVKAAERTAITPHVTATALKLSPKLATRPTFTIPKPKQPVKTSAVVNTTTVVKPVAPVKTARPAITNKALNKPKAARFSGLCWLPLGFSLVFFGVALVMFYSVVVADNMSEQEKAYLDQVVQLNQQTNEVNSQLHDAIDQYNAGKLEKAELQKNLRQVISMGEKFRLLKSPSTRFVKLNELLSQAYNYLNQGAVSLILGLNSNEAGRVIDGSRLLGLGNDYLRQASDELKALGG